MLFFESYSRTMPCGSTRSSFSAVCPPSPHVQHEWIMFNMMLGILVLVVAAKIRTRERDSRKNECRIVSWFAGLSIEPSPATTVAAWAPSERWTTNSSMNGPALISIQHHCMSQPVIFLFTLGLVILVIPAILLYCFSCYLQLHCCTRLH